MKDLIHAYKYKALVPLSGILSGLMIDFIKDNMEIIDGIDMLTSVPLGRRRFIERGFNQASVLAKGVSDAFGIPFADTLIKRRRTAHQNELARDERLKNLKGAFAARNLSILKNKAVLLIDDVMTTGSTLDECSMVILSCGAAEVRCLTLARGA
jgi:ComF family protein